MKPGCKAGKDMASLVFIMTFLLMAPQLKSISAENITEDDGMIMDDLRKTEMCPDTIKVRWDELLAREPHVIKQVSGNETSYDGLFPLNLVFMISSCCSSTVIKYVDAYQADIVLPVILNYKESGLSSQSKVVPILPNTGVAFVVKRADRKHLPIKILSSIFSSWPVLVLTLLLSVLAGIVAWILDTRQNTEEFPLSFVQGSWEGFWWAFVSMTTVGYGDRCPKTISGRLFAIVWILTGICMCSIFTAMLTTSLTTISLDTMIPLPQAKVAALFGSIEATTGFQRQAQVRRVHSIKEIQEEILEGKAIGGLMDSFTLDHYRDYFPANEFKVQEVISQEYLEYGALIENSSLVSLVKCLKNLRFSEESEMYEYAELYMGKSMKSGLEESMTPGDQTIGVDPEGLLFYPALFTCLGILTFFLISGATWEMCRRTRMRKSERGATNKVEFLVSNTNDTETQKRTALLREFEEQVAGDVRKALMSLRQKFSDRFLLPEKNCSSETQETWTSV
ncbi:uncharacterized protein [Pocillopora verrucosa]|uniref:uncharacterized protein isoform X2 n=1 Tax=Pocillopora verrucosa TaxID=203993 RepID=UPI0033421325